MEENRQALRSVVVTLIDPRGTDIVRRELSQSEQTQCLATNSLHLDAVSLHSPQGLADALKQICSSAEAVDSRVDELAVILLSDDEFPKWPSLNMGALSALTKSLLVVRARPNLSASWAALANGALNLSRAGDTICSITVHEYTSDVCVCKNGEIIDTAAMGIGSLCLLFDSDLRITSISESGETFLDAVAKKIEAADLVEETMVSLIAALLAEAFANLICRKKAPQVTQRLLNSDALKHDYEIERIIVSGVLVDLMRQPVADPRSLGHLGGYLADNLTVSFEERGRSLELTDTGILADTILGSISQSVHLVDPASPRKQGATGYALSDSPVIVVPDWFTSYEEEQFRFLSNRIEERLRRYHTVPGAPLQVAFNLVPRSETAELSHKMDATTRDLNLSADTIEKEANLGAGTIDKDSIVRLASACRQAVDKAMFLKKPSDFVVLVGLPFPEKELSDPNSTTSKLVQALSGATIPQTRLLLAMETKFVDGHYLTWDDANSPTVHATLKRLLFTN